MWTRGNALFAAAGGYLILRLGTTYGIETTEDLLQAWLRLSVPALPTTLDIPDLGQFSEVWEWLRQLLDVISAGETARKVFKWVRRLLTRR